MGSTKEIKHMREGLQKFCCKSGGSTANKKFLFKNFDPVPAPPIINVKSLEGMNPRGNEEKRGDRSMFLLRITACTPLA